eukprot:3729224-Rhodomonas_salina.2
MTNTNTYPANAPFPYLRQHSPPIPRNALGHPKGPQQRSVGAACCMPNAVDVVWGLRSDL